MNIKPKNLRRILEAARAMVSDEDLVGRTAESTNPYVSRRSRGVYVSVRLWVPMDAIRADKHPPVNGAARPIKVVY